MDFFWKGTMFLGIEMGFWAGMIVTGAITLACCLLAWLVPPQKKKPTVTETAE